MGLGQAKRNYHKGSIYAPPCFG